MSVMALVTVAACPSPDAVDPTPPDLRIIGTGDVQRLAQGGTTLYTVGIARTAFTGPVSLAVASGGLPTGVSVDFDPATLGPGVTQSTVRVSASPTTPVQYTTTPPTTSIPIVATGPDGLKATAALQVQLVPSSLAGVTLNATPTAITIGLTQTANALATIARQGNYTGAVTLAVRPATQESLLDGTATAVTGTPDTWQFRAAVRDAAKVVQAALLAGGGYTERFVLSASGPGITTVETAVAVTVTVPAFRPFTAERPTIAQGGAATVNVELRRQSRFPDAIQMNLAGAPAGVTATFSPNPAPDDATAMTVRVAPTVPPGTYAMTITGTLPASAGGQSFSGDFGITVVAPGYSFTVGDVRLSPGNSATSDVRLTRTGNFAAPVAVTVATLDGRALPAGMTVTLDTASIRQNNATLRVTTTAATPPGFYAMQATGTAPGTTPQTAAFGITVLPPAFTLRVPNVTVQVGNTATTTATITPLAGAPASLGVSLSAARSDGSALPAGMRLIFEAVPAVANAPELQVSTTAATPPGSYQFTATGTTTNAGTATTTFTVVVTAPVTSVVTRVAIEPANAEITAPASQQYVARLYNASGVEVAPEPGSTLTWTSSAAALAGIDANGVARGARAGVTTITAIYTLGSNVRTDGTPLTVYAAGSPGHAGSMTFSSQGNVRTLRRGDSVLVQLIVRNTAGDPVTAGVNPAPTMSSSNAGALRVQSTTGPVPGYFFWVVALSTSPTGIDVRLRYDVTGAGGEVTMRITP